VEVLTRAAMEGNLDLEEVYARRLRAVRPTRRQVRAIHQVYKQNTVEDARPVIAALQALGHQVYIISGGLAEPVREFGLYLGVPAANIRAVDVRYDTLSGRWWDQAEQDPLNETHYLNFDSGSLTISDGKAQIVQELLQKQPGRSLLVGDGYSDLLAGRAVNLFAGYGGVVRREQVEAVAPCYIHSPSLSPVLALAAGPEGLLRLHDTPFASLCQKAFELIETGAITFRHEQLRTKFHEAYQAVHSRTH
jgi:phosphoserine phosphatase